MRFAFDFFVKKLNNDRERWCFMFIRRRKFLFSSLFFLVGFPFLSFSSWGRGVMSGFNDWKLSKEQWRERLSEAQFRVLREEGTERSYTSDLLHEKREGQFVCAGCDLPLFDSSTKYDSRTGWPSFYDVLPNAIGTKRDFLLVFPRTEYHCVRCGGHQGHIFNDGPQPTGLRYCNNGVALRFIAHEVL